MHGSGVSWRSKKQSTISQSSTEAEMQAMSDTFDEILWLRKITQELKLQGQLPTLLMCDNKSSISFATNANFSHNLKHINVNYFAMKDDIEAGRIELKYVPTDFMIADVLTKAVGPNKIEVFQENVGLSDQHTSIESVNK